MEKIFSKLFSIVLVFLLVLNLFYYAIGRVDLLFFWLNLLVIGLISFFVYGDKSKLKNFKFN